MQQEANANRECLGLKAASILMLIFAVAAMCFCTLWYFIFLPEYERLFSGMGVKLPAATLILFEIPPVVFKILPIALAVVLITLEIAVSRKLVTFWTHLAAFLLSMVFWAFIVLACLQPTTTLLQNLQGD